ncbi:MAG: RNA methyltransferase [Bacteroidales bacterium]|nr:RNA methyltransferase [Bacteroidales bacterium]
MPERKINTPGLFDKYTIEQKQKLYETLSEFYSDNKRELFDRLVQHRTKHIAVVLEDIYQSHNASAVLRSCDCFGVQDVHVVESRNQFNPAEDVAVGSSKWIDYYKHNNIQEAYNHLHDKGYRIIATLPHENDTMIGDLDLSRPVALVFGTELTGLTQEAINGADGYVKIPMYGFTESFNISVCAALSLFSTTERMRKDNDIKWQLTPEQQLELKLYWSLQVIRDGEKVLKNIIEKLNF